MLFGAHESVAGGLHLAVARGEKDGCRAIQIFTKNASTWREPVLSEQQVETFRDEHARWGGGPVFSHTSYLINLASTDTTTLARSRDALVQEVRRASSLGLLACVLHPGAHLGAGIDQGVRRVAESLLRVLDETAGEAAMILLENTAGQGTCVGHRFEQLAGILELVDAAPRVGVCIDTQHAFAAGYDWTTDEGYAGTLRALDETVGVAAVRAFHLNDSKKPLSSRVDRHEHIGEGLLGLESFRRLVREPRFAQVPAVVETEPRAGEFPYREEIALLAELAAHAPAVRRARKRGPR